MINIARKHDWQLEEIRPVIEALEKEQLLQLAPLISQSRGGGA